MITADFETSTRLPNNSPTTKPTMVTNCVKTPACIVTVAHSIVLQAKLAKAGMRRRSWSRQLLILLAILRVGDDAYGVPIAREIEATGRRTVLLGAVYAALERLQDMGLVSSSVGDPTPERGGKAKRFFRVTSKGLKSVKDTQRALVAMWTNVPALKGGAA